MLTALKTFSNLFNKFILGSWDVKNKIILSSVQMPWHVSRFEWYGLARS